MRCSNRQCKRMSKYEFGTLWHGMQFFCIDHYTEAVERLFGRLGKMIEEYSEKRTDVAEMLDEIMSDEDVAIKAESRFVSADLGDGRRVEYDSLTNWLTLVEGECSKHLEDYEYRS